MQPDDEDLSSDLVVTIEDFHQALERLLNRVGRPRFEQAVEQSQLPPAAARFLRHEGLPTHESLARLLSALGLSADEQANFLDARDRAELTHMVDSIHAQSGPPDADRERQSATESIRHPSWRRRAVGDRLGLQGLALLLLVLLLVPPLLLLDDSKPSAGIVLFTVPVMVAIWTILIGQRVATARRRRRPVEVVVLASAIWDIAMEERTLVRSSRGQSDPAILR